MQVSKITSPNGEHGLLYESDRRKFVRSESYNYNFRKSDGYFMRWGKTYEDDPQFSPFGCEILDLETSIGSCSFGAKEDGTPALCKFCYKNQRFGPGTHMTLSTFARILDRLRLKPDGALALSQVALGLTDLDANPDLIPILRHARKNGVVPNFTCSGPGVSESLVQECAKYVGAVAVSCYTFNRDLCYKTAWLFSEAGVKQTNVHLLYYKQNKGFVKEALAEMADIPWINAVVLLALKPVGRAADNSLTPVTYPEFKEIVEYAMEIGAPLGFDSCTAPKFMKFVNESDMSQREKDHYATVCEPCEAAAASAYLNVFGDFYPCSFMEGVGDWETGLPILECDDFLSDIWFHERSVAWRDNLISRGRTCPQYNI